MHEVANDVPHPWLGAAIGAKRPQYMWKGSAGAQHPLTHFRLQRSGTAIGPLSVRSWSMITTNLPEFVKQLRQLGDVRVIDRMDTIELRFATAVNMDALDELVCDALFVDPLGREQNKRGCTLEVAKRSKLRHASEMRVVGADSSARYEC